MTNRAYRDTVGDILTFFHRYNPQFLAHRVECSIDYQLFLPVGEELVGISYLNAYLSRLLLGKPAAAPVFPGGAGGLPEGGYPGL